jgi:hypothetical protein
MNPVERFLGRERKKNDRAAEMKEKKDRASDEAVMSSMQKTGMQK